MKKYTLLGLVALLIAGCSGGSGDRQLSSRSGGGGRATEDAIMQTSGSAEAGSPAEGGKDESSAPLSLPRKIIYTGNVHLVTENLDAASEKLESSLKGFGAYVGDANKTGSRGTTRSASWTVRIPVQQYDPFLKFIRTLGELQSDSRQAQDVSEEYYDVEARLKNKRIEEARLIDLLQKATGKLSEILTVEKELNRVREESERIEGRLRFLRNQTDLSTITIAIEEVKNYQPEGPPNLKTQVSRTFGGSIDAMKGVGVGLLLFVVAVVPWVLPLALIAWLIYRAINRPKPKAQEPVEPPPFETTE